MKFGIVVDWLLVFAGAERVIKAIYELYPSDVFCLVAKDEVLREVGIPGEKVRESFVSKLPFSREKYRSYLPLFPLAIEEFDLSGYDVVISSSHAVAKGVLTKKDQLHICYCHTPALYAWDLYHHYIRAMELERGLKGFFVKAILHYFRIWDTQSVDRVDYFVANAMHVARRIEKIYGKPAEVIYPPVDVDSFTLGEDKEEFYLTASRMVPHKMIPLVVEAFSKLPDRRLVVIGDGPELGRVKSIAKGKKNIEVLGYQPTEVLRNYMQRAKAFIFAGEEDFGIMPVEAMACGTPVIAFGKGGATETVIDGKTGIFFYEQSVDSLIDGITRFEKIQDKLDSLEIRKNSERFSTSKFKERFKEFVERKIREFYG